MTSSSSGPRVALLGPWPPPFGGVQTHLVALRDGLRAAGATVGVFNITRHRGTPADDVYFPDGPADLLRQMRAFRPDVVHVHLGGELTSRLLALLVACRAVFGRRIVVTMHSGGYPRSERARALTTMSAEGFVFRSLAHVIVVNRELKQLFERIGCRPERVTELIPTLGVPEPAKTLPAQLDRFMADAAPLIVTVGLLEDEYLLPLQLLAFGKFVAAYPQARFVIIGSGSRRDAIEAEIRAMPAGAQVLLSGDTAHPVTVALIKRAAMLWRITAFDGDSVSVREAIAIGTPVLATDNGMRPPEVHLVAADAAAIADRAIALQQRDAKAERSDDASVSRYAAVLSSHVKVVLDAAARVR